MSDLELTQLHPIKSMFKFVFEKWWLHWKLLLKHTGKCSCLVSSVFAEVDVKHNFGGLCFWFSESYMSLILICAVGQPVTTSSYCAWFLICVTFSHKLLALWLYCSTTQCPRQLITLIHETSLNSMCKFSMESSCTCHHMLIEAWRVKLLFYSHHLAFPLPSFFPSHRWMCPTHLEKGIVHYSTNPDEKWEGYPCFSAWSTHTPPLTQSNMGSCQCEKSICVQKQNTSLSNNELNHSVITSHAKQDLIKRATRARSRKGEGEVGGCVCVCGGGTSVLGETTMEGGIKGRKWEGFVFCGAENSFCNMIWLQICRDQRLTWSHIEMEF